MDILTALGVFGALYLVAAGLCIGLVWVGRAVVGRWVNPQLGFALARIAALTRPARSKKPPLTESEQRDATVLSAVILAGRSGVVIVLLIATVATARLAWDVYQAVAAAPAPPPAAIVVQP